MNLTMWIISCSSQKIVRVRVHQKKKPKKSDNDGYIKYANEIVNKCRMRFQLLYLIKVTCKAEREQLQRAQNRNYIVEVARKTSDIKFLTSMHTNYSILSFSASFTFTFFHRVNF